jgi:hypothetical protein
MAELLPAQESHWELMCALSPRSPGDCRFLVVDNRFVDAPLDPAAIRGAFDDVTRRHDALRLVFDDVSVRPRIRIEPWVQPPVEYLDLTGLSPSAQQDRIGEIVFAELHRGFDLLRGPAWHAWCVRLAPDRHFLNVCFAEIIADGWASKVFMEDLFAAYAVRTGSAAPPPDPLSLAQMQAIQSARLEPRPERLDYWREQLLPLSRPALFEPRVSDDTSLLVRHRIDVDFDPAQLAALHRLAWRARTSVYIVLMAAYHVLLGAATGQDRTVLSTAALGRYTSAERRSLLPCTIDPYVVTTLAPDRTLGEAVSITHTALDRAMAHLVGYTSLARAVNPRFDDERPWPDLNLCDGNFFSAAFEDHEVVLSGLQVSMPRLRSKVPADLSEVTLLAGSLPARQLQAWVAYGGPSMEVSHARDGCALVYNGQLYSHEDMRTHMAGYLEVVRLMATAPELTVGAVAGQLAGAGLVAGLRTQAPAPSGRA